MVVMKLGNRFEQVGHPPWRAADGRSGTPGSEDGVYDRLLSAEGVIVSFFPFRNCRGYNGGRGQKFPLHRSWIGGCDRLVLVTRQIGHPRGAVLGVLYG